MKSVNAGIADTDSAFGTARLERDVVVHQPDLLFVEFSAVAGEHERQRNVERIVRKAARPTPVSTSCFCTR